MIFSFVRRTCGSTVVLEKLLGFWVPSCVTTRSSSGSAWCLFVLKTTKLLLLLCACMRAAVACGVWYVSYVSRWGMMGGSLGGMFCFAMRFVVYPLVVYPLVVYYYTYWWCTAQSLNLFLSNYVWDDMNTELSFYQTNNKPRDTTAVAVVPVLYQAYCCVLLTHMQS